jgi:hypothetical protein
MLKSEINMVKIQRISRSFFMGYQDFNIDPVYGTLNLMSKLKKSALTLLLLIQIIMPGVAFASTTDDLIKTRCDSRGVAASPQQPTIGTNQPVNINFKITDLKFFNPNYTYRIGFFREGNDVFTRTENDVSYKATPAYKPAGYPPVVSLDGLSTAGKYHMMLYIPNAIGLVSEPVCVLPTILNVVPRLLSQVPECQYSLPKTVKVGEEYKFNIPLKQISGVRYNLYIYKGTRTVAEFNPTNGSFSTSISGSNTADIINNLEGGISNGNATGVINKLQSIGPHTAVVFAAAEGYYKACWATPFEVLNQDTSKEMNTGVPAPVATQSAEVCTPDDPECTSSAGIRCDSASGQAIKNGGDGILTAIGCIPTEPKAFIQKFLGVALAASGGLALLLMIAGSFKVITAQGNPDSLKAGREQFTAALIGLVFIIFSVLIMRIIGVQILDLGVFK